MPGYVRARGKRQDGSIKWQARYWDPLDTTRRIEKVFKAKRDAERWLTQQGAAIYDGTHIDPRRADRPFAAVADEWRETWTDLEPKTRAGYESILNQHVIPRFGTTKVGAVTPEAIQRYVNELADKRASNTVRRIFSVIRGVLRVAVERRYIAVSPCDAVRLPRKGVGRTGERKGRMLFLAPADVRALAAAMPERNRLPVYVAAYCGLRAGELWALRRRDVDPLGCVLRVERALKEIHTTADALQREKGLVFGPTKTHAARKMTLPRFLCELLAAHLAQPSPGGNGPDDLLFPTKTGKPTRHSLFYRRRFRPAVRVLWPKGHRLHALRWHDLRHTCASLSLAVAPNLHVVKERLGHDDIRTTVNVYGHLLPSVDAALADGLGALYAADERSC
jgi:integrase